MTPTQHIGLIIVSLGLTFMLTGCGAPIKTYAYSWGAIHKTTQQLLNEQCGEVYGIKEWDDGSYVKPGEDFGGCNRRENFYCSVWISEWSSVAHEEAHCDGVADPGEDYE